MSATLNTGKIAVVMGVVFLSVALLPARADAAFILKLSDGATTVLVHDDVVGEDLAPATPGLISFAGVVGTFLNASLSVSKPLNPASPNFAHISLDSPFNFNTGAANPNFEVSVTDTDFPATPSGTFRLDVSGSVASGGSVSFTGYKDPTNTEFGTSATTVALGPFPPPNVGFSASGSILHSAFPTYSMTIVTLFSLPSGGNLDLSADVFNIPEPFSLTLFGTGLVGLGLAAARRRRQLRTRRSSNLIALRHRR